MGVALVPLLGRGVPLRSGLPWCQAVFARVVVASKSPPGYLPTQVPLPYVTSKYPRGIHLSKYHPPLLRLEVPPGYFEVPGGTYLRKYPLPYFTSTHPPGYFEVSTPSPTLPISYKKILRSTNSTLLYRHTLGDEDRSCVSPMCVVVMSAEIC